MKRYEQTVVQLEEAKRLIQIGTVPHLRLALLLLDNLAELLIFRAVKNELQYAEMYERMLQSHESTRDGAVTLGLIKEWEEHLAHLKKRVLSKRERRRLEKDFNAKVDFVVKSGKLAQPVGRVLKHLHVYRNRTYHDDNIQRGSLKPAVLVYFDIVCTLFETLRPGSTSWNGTEQWLTRYGLSPQIGSLEQITQVIATIVRKDVDLTAAVAVTALATHLHERVGEMEQDLEFIAANAGWSPGVETLTAVQYWHDHHEDPERIPTEYSPRYRKSNFDSWRDRADGFRGLANKVQAFAQFADIEDEIEPIEELLHAVSIDIDRAIQLQIDIARGK